MSKFFLLLFVVSLSSNSAKAQNCTPENVAKYPGTWKQGMQGTVNGITASSLAKEKEIVAGFVKRLQQSLKPDGCNINYSGVYGYVNPDLVKNRKTNEYELSMFQMHFYCENDQVKVYPETPYWARIQVNKIPYFGNQSFFVQTTKYEEDLDTDQLFTIDAMPVKDRSVWLLKGDYTTIKGYKNYIWIISYNNELPYHYVTQKELCTKLIAYYEKRIRYARIEIDIEYNKKLIASAEDYLKKTPEAVLKRPAQVGGSMATIFYQYWDNVPPFDPDGDYVIDISPNYFKASLPMHTPQIITLNFIVHEKNELSMNTMYKMVEALNIENLKTMLGNPNTSGKTIQPVKNTQGDTKTTTTELTQNCTSETVAKYPGTWKQGKGGSIDGVSSLTLAKQKEFTTNMVKQLRQNFQPEGFNIFYSGVHLRSKSDKLKNGKADSYEVSMPIMPLYCEDGKIKQQPETHFWLNVMVNTLPLRNPESFFVPKQIDEPDPFTDLIFQIDNKPEKDRGGWLLKRKFIGSFVFSRKDNELTEYQWVFPYDDKLPFRYVSQKEVCEKLLSYYKKIIMYSDSESDVAFSKKRTGYVEEYLAKTPAAKLSSPAIIRGSVLSTFNNYEDAGAFYKETDSYISWVVDFDKNYFKPGLPLHTPQLITVKFEFQDQDSLQVAAMYKMVDALDFNSMKKMLGNPTPFVKTNQPAKDATGETRSQVPTNKNNTTNQPSTTVKQETKPSPAQNKNNTSAPPQNQPSNSFDPTKPVYDLDGNQYTVIKIGKQYWLKENLRTTKYNDTTAIATGLNDNEWKQTKSGAFAVYQNNAQNNQVYGKLYNGYAVITGKLCPKGWRIPLDKDWLEMEQFLGLDAAELERTGERGAIAFKLKTKDGWKPSSFNNDNTSGFSILPAGSRLDNGEYTTLFQYGNFWTSSVYDDRYGLLYLWNHHVHYNTHAVGRIYTLANNGYSCRCILDTDANKQSQTNKK